MVKLGCVIIMKSASPAPMSIAPERLYMCVLFTAAESVFSAREEHGVDNTAAIFPWSRPKAPSTCAQTRVKCDVALLKEEAVWRG